MDKYDQKKGTATSTLIYYMQHVWEKTGLRWTSDNASEMEGLVDAIVNAAVAEVKTEYKKGQFPNKYT